MKKNVIHAGEDPQNFSIYEVGGKGLNLLRLYQLAQETGLFDVPNFFIIPADAERKMDNADGRLIVDFEGLDVQEVFEGLRKPIAIRSSSPLEDGVQASFAGIFNSYLDNATYEDARSSFHKIIESAWSIHADEYARKMGVDPETDMAIIVQEQVTDVLVRGVIQLYDSEAILEEISPNGRRSTGTYKYSFLAEVFPSGIMNRATSGKEWLIEEDSYYAIECAREAEFKLGLDGVVQVEFLLVPSQQPKFVQIRQLPKVKTYAFQLDMNIPDCVPYLESEVCNDIAGEIVLPAYVTTSKAGLSSIIINTGQADILNVGKREDRIAKDFLQNSRLAQNPDYQYFSSLLVFQKKKSEASVLPLFNDEWEEGNNLFSEYILVCDKLDETYAGMANLTTNKRAIITCLEARQTSHAMTVARDLGIPAMGVNGDIRDMDYFFNQVETGDLIHMKSDGRRAVAFIERKRQIDPYQK